MEQETLEEAAENGWFNTNSMSVEHKEGFIEGFIQGANYQAERMYSEGDLREAFKQSRQSLIFEKDMPPVHNEFEDWFEQFKKR